MKSPFYFIVKPVNNKRYSNTIEVGERELVVSTSQEDHMFSNRFAEVVATPVKYDGEIQKGDTLLVHHNVFKLYYDMKGREKSGKSFFKDNLFLLDEEQDEFLKTEPEELNISEEEIREVNDEEETDTLEEVPLEEVDLESLRFS